MTQPSELDDETLYNYLLQMQEDERTAYIADLGDDDRARVNSLLMYGYTPTDDAENPGVEEQAEDAYPGYENREQPQEGDYSGWPQNQGEQEEENEDENEDGTDELAEDANADTGWKAPSTDENTPPDNEQMFARELDDVLNEGDPLGRDDDETNEDETDEDEQTEDERTDDDDDLDIRPEEEEDEAQDDEAPPLDYDAAAQLSSAEIAKIVARNSTNRTTTFMQLPGGEFLFGSGHDINLVATAAGGSGTIRFNRNRLSANDFIVENESGDVDYEGLQDLLRSICGARDEYDYGDHDRVRVK